jgi:predicted Rossmann fold nucleotide-binding protein DprA/Smf involved in DNA uptake
MEPQYQGNKELLKRTLTAFLASRTVQTNRVMTCYDWATSLDAETDCVVSGFQSPIEKDVLHFLLKKKIPVIVVLARSLYKNIPEELQEAFDAGRVLFISISNNPRNSNAAGKQRNQYVTDLAQQTVFGMLSEQSSLYDLYLKFKENRRNVVIL